MWREHFVSDSCQPEIARKEAEKRRAGDEAARGPPAPETVTCRDAPASTVLEADVKAEAGERKLLTASGASEPACKNLDSVGSRYMN